MLFLLWQRGVNSEKNMAIAEYRIGLTVTTVTAPVSMLFLLLQRVMIITENNCNNSHLQKRHNLGYVHIQNIL